MKIILMSVGTRGDIEPFLSIGEFLKEKGHYVICSFPEQFRQITVESDLEFASLGAKFIELLESDDGKAALGGSGSGFSKFLATVRLARQQTDINKELVHKQYEILENEKPDSVVYNGKAVYPLIWELKNRGKTIFVSPLPYMHYVKGHTHVAFNSNFGTPFNKLTFSLAHFGMVTTVMMAKKWLKITEEIRRKEILNILRYNKSIYTISPSLFSKPDDWKVNIQVLGYHARKNKDNWQPDKSLIDFIRKHEKILFITFGSMTNPDPEGKTNMILDILERNKIPAILNTASGGLVKPQNFNSDHIHFVSRIPYDWIFPRIYGVIHHGGSGTTHLALRYGCATMIIPHIIDQHVWDKITSDLGVGPKGVKIGKISVNNLEPKIMELLTSNSYKMKAELVRDQMNKEDFKEELYNSITQ